MRSVITALVSLTVASVPVNAGLGDQLFQLQPTDGASGDDFGYTIAVDDGLVAVGAPGDDLNGADSGSAYLFDAATGTQLLQLVPRDGGAGDAFGFAIAIDGPLVVVGARLNDENGVDAGAAYVFDASTGTQIAKILATDGVAGDEFGSAVAIDGGIIAVGAKRDDDAGVDSGSVYLFDATTGDQLEKLVPNDAAASDNFGGAVAMDDGLVAVGAHAKWNGPLFLAGAAYLFDASSGDQLHKLLANDAAVNDFFGSAIDIDSGVVVVGAWAKSIVFDHSGAAYLFDASTGDQITRLVPADTWDRDHFGRSVAISDDLVAVGASQDDDKGFNSGSVYLFDAATGDETSKLVAADGDVADLFGWSCAMEAGVLAVGAYRNDVNGDDSGAAYIFDAGVGTCPADLADGDSQVVTPDLLALLAAWGTDGPGADLAAPAAIVDVADLLTLLGAWGSCPE